MRDSAWTFASVYNPYECRSYTMLCHRTSGCIMELVHYPASIFIFKESVRATPQACYLRGLTLSRPAKFTAPCDFQALMESGEAGDPFPVPRNINNKSLNHLSEKIPGWKVIYSQGHFVIRGTWGCEIWLLEQGFVAIASLTTAALVIENCEVHACSRDEAVSMLSSLDIEALLNYDFKSIQENEKIPCPCVKFVRKDIEMPCIGSNQHKESFAVHSHQEKESLPTTRALPSIYKTPSRPGTRSAPPNRKPANECGEIVGLLKSLAKDGVLDSEMFEVCKQNAEAANLDSLCANLVHFIPSNVYERVLVSQQDCLLSLRDEIEKIEEHFSGKIATLHRIHEERCAKLQAARTCLLQEVARIQAETEQSQLENEFEEDEVPNEEVIQLHAEIASVDEAIAALSQQTAEDERALREEEARAVTTKRVSAAVLSQEIKDLHRRATASRREARDGISDTKRVEDSRRLRSQQKLLRRPDAVREHRDLLRGVTPAAIAAESSTTSRNDMRLLAATELEAVFTRTRTQPAQCDAESRRALAAAENRRLLSTAAGVPAAACHADPADEEGRFLRRRLAALGHVNMLRAIRRHQLSQAGPGASAADPTPKAPSRRDDDNPGPPPRGGHARADMSAGGYGARVAFAAEVLRLEDCGPEDRAVVYMDGRRYLTSRGSASRRRPAPLLPRRLDSLKRASAGLATCCLASRPQRAQAQQQPSPLADTHLGGHVRFSAPPPTHPRRRDSASVAILTHTAAVGRQATPEARTRKATDSRRPRVRPSRRPVDARHGTAGGKGRGGGGCQWLPAAAPYKPEFGGRRRLHGLSRLGRFRF